MTSKVAIVGPSSQPDADVDYLFAQVATDRAFVDFSPNCGNMLSAVGPFAIEAGLVPAEIGETTVRIFNRNTSTTIEAVVQTPAGIVEYEGETAIDGVPGTAAPVKLTFLMHSAPRPARSCPPATFANSSRTRRSRSSTTPCRGAAGPDPASPVMKRPMNSKPTWTSWTAWRPSGWRRDAGLGDVSGSVVPLDPVRRTPRRDDHLTLLHERNAATRATPSRAPCIAAACRLPGSVAHDLATPSLTSLVNLEHPSGRTGDRPELQRLRPCLAGKSCPHRPQNLRGQRHRPGKRCRCASGRDTTRRRPCPRPSHADCSVARFGLDDDCGTLSGAIAQESFPTRPMKLVVPYGAAGGGTDAIARLVAQGVGRSSDRA